MAGENKYYTDILAQFETYLQHSVQEHMSAPDRPTELYEPMQYALGQGGKRVRPLCTLLASKLLNAERENILPIAAALELFHNFTLLHDDVMDHSDMRRGRPSVVAKYGLSTAILSGDAMFALAFHILVHSEAGITAPIRSEISQAFSRMCLAIMEGQQFDMNYEDAPDTSIAEYIRMIRLKTAELFAAALKIGALAGNCGTELSNQLYNCGIDIGIAFQLRDDYLDVYGTSEVFGKPIGGDIAENKKTWLLLKASEKAREAGDDSLEKALLLEDKDEKFRTVKALYDHYQVPQAIDEEINRYTQQALQQLDAIRNNYTVSQEPLTELCKLFKRMAGRHL